MEGQSSYKDLMVWQKSMVFANEVIEKIDELDTPRKHYRLFEQLESAATSIPMNIAEGMQSTPTVRVETQKKSLFTFYISLVVPCMRP